MIISFPNPMHEPTLRERCEAARDHLRLARLAARAQMGAPLVRRELRRARSEIRAALRVIETAARETVHNRARPLRAARLQMPRSFAALAKSLEAMSSAFAARG
jgi:hypothetical protein